MEHELKEADFPAEVLQAEGLVLVDFYAVWCGPCGMIAPHVAKLAEDFPALKVCRLDVDTATPVAIEYGVTSIPTLIFFRNGEPVRTLVGYRTYDQLRAAVEELL